MNSGSKVVCLTLIAGRKYKDGLLSLLAKEGGQLIEISYGRGAYKATYIQDALGLVPEECKVLITCLLSDSKTQNVFNCLVEDFNFNKANTGIAFTIPVEKISF